MLCNFEFKPRQNEHTYTWLGPLSTLKPHLPRRFSPDWPIGTWPRPWHYFHSESKKLHREQRFEREKMFFTLTAKNIYLRVKSKKVFWERFFFLLRNHFKNFKFIFLYALVSKSQILLYFAIGVKTFSLKHFFFSQIIYFLTCNKDTDLTPYVCSCCVPTLVKLCFDTRPKTQDWSSGPVQANIHLQAHLSADTREDTWSPSPLAGWSIQ